MSKPAWQHIEWTFGGLTVALAAGALFDRALLFVAVALAAMLGWHVWNLVRFERWLRRRTVEQPPDMSGLWGEVLAITHRVYRRKVFHKRRVTSLLREFRRMTSAMPDGAVLLGQNREILWFNRTAGRWLGLKRKLDYGIRIDNLVRNPDFVEYLDRRGATAPPRIHLPKNGDRWLLVRLVTTNATGQQLLILRDVTSEARLESMRKDFVANASHELRSPLARIRLALELLQRDASPDHRAALKRELERDIGELDQLIDEILLASRLDAQGAAREAPFEPLDLTALAAEECARFGARLEAGPIAAVGDARLLRRLLRNLLDNARRHAPGAPIDVTLRARPGEVELTVADRGPGVDEAERSRIFEPFYRPRGAGESAGGAGLGLALAARIAHRHRGTVACLPRAGGGTEFVVRLPIAAD